MKNNIWSILCLICLLIMVIGGLYYWNNPFVVSETRTETIYETKYDSIDKIVYIDRPNPSAVLPPDTVFIYDQEKCEQLFADHFSKRIYNDTLQNDSFAFISLMDTVFMNRLMGRTLTYKDRTPTEFITTTTTTTNIVNSGPRFRLFAGPIVTYSPDIGSGIGAGVMFSSKTFAAGYSYDFARKTNSIQLYYSIFRNENKNQNK